MKALLRVGAHHRVHPQVQHLQLVVPGADGQVVPVARQVQAGHLAAQQDLVGRLGGAGAGVPESDLLVEVGADDGELGRHHVVAAGAGIFGGDARLAPQVPDSQGPVVAAAHHTVRVHKKFSRHHLHNVGIGLQIIDE